MESNSESNDVPHEEIAAQKYRDRHKVSQKMLRLLGCTRTNILDMAILV